MLGDCGLEGNVLQPQSIFHGFGGERKGSGTGTANFAKQDSRSFRNLRKRVLPMNNFTVITQRVQPRRKNWVHTNTCVFFIRNKNT